MDATPEALTYEIFRKRIHPDDLAIVDREFEAAVREKRDFSHTYRILLQDGRVRWVQARARTFYDGKGKPMRMIGTNIDVTETIQAQEAVRESAIRFRELAESMPQIVWATDPSGKAYYYNSQWFEYLGVPRTEAASFEGQKFIHPDDKGRVQQRWEDAVQTRTMFQVEIRMKSRDGSYHWFLSRALPISNSQGSLVRWYGTLTNIDEHKKVEEMTSRALKTREEMLAIVSHDLRNPLGSILMSAAMIKRKSRSEDAFILAQANKIQRAGERMNEMIEDLLNLAKMEAGKYSLSKREICGCDVVTEAVEMMSAQAQEKNIKIETRGIDQPLQMSCDHSQVLRVFSNLIGNAIKFTPEHGVVYVTAEDQGDEVLFTVSDTGPGIAEHHIPHVFDRFWQASNTQHMGTGLGLAISKGIIEAHGGRIWVTSRFGHGATFLFTLPKARTGKREQSA
jgi:PAS domain S-box-containing protein